MKAKIILVLVLFLSLIAGRAVAQPVPLTSTSYVTEIVTDYGGYWRSGNATAPNAARSLTRPDNSHRLLAFVVNSGTTTANGNTFVLANKYFSTGVNDALLASQGLPYTPSRYQALPVNALSGTVTGSTKVALGQLYDQVDGGASAPPPASGYAQYLTDGPQGLDLGTGTANLPAGTLTFTVSGLSAAAIGDGVPDILITQIASPSGVVDSYQFLDASGAPVAGTQSRSANFTNVPHVGTWTVDFYEASQAPMTLTADFTKTPRELRLLAVDFSAFGLTAGNLSSVRQFQITLSGDSDQAFVAYNTNAATLAPLPVQLVAFTAQAVGAGTVRLAWTTASELNSAYFDVEASADGVTFAAVGRVAAAGSSASQRHYQFGHQPAWAGQHYYRLRQVDLDGTAYYSPVVVVRTGAAAVVVYPVPAGAGQLLTVVNLPALAAVQVLDALGRTVAAGVADADGTARLALPAGLAPGFYAVRGGGATRRLEVE